MTFKIYDSKFCTFVEDESGAVRQFRGPIIAKRHLRAEFGGDCVFVMAAR